MSTSSKNPARKRTARKLGTGEGIDFDPKRLRAARTMRRAGLLGLFALLALGVAGAFDPAEGEEFDSAGSVEMEVSFPERTRAGFESPLGVLVTDPGGFDGPVELAIRRDWLELFDLGAIDPVPGSATGDDETLIWTFEPPPGAELKVTVSLTLRPAVRSGEEGRVALLEDGNEAAAVSFDTRVVP